MGWAVFVVALAFTLACIALAVGLNDADLENANHDLELDELWRDE